MTIPIVLWNPKFSAVRETDDAGVNVIKTALPLLHSYTPRYRAYDPTKPRKFTHVPRLAAFCIRALSQYPEQLHQLGATRLHFHPGKDGTDSVLCSVLPKWGTPNFSLLDLDPRLWATIVQIYRNPPDILSSYPCHLSDPHVPLLNQIPCTPDFTLLTILDLASSSDLTDSNILSLKVLHNLTALDVSGCYHISTRGIEALSRTVALNEDGEKRGPWMLRILRMRSCENVNKAVFNALHSFPLLSIVDLRRTRCQKQDIKQPFFSAEDNIFDIPLTDAVKRFSQEHRSVFPAEIPHILSLQANRWSNTMCRTHTLPETSTMPSRHNNFVVLPASRGSTNPCRRQRQNIQFGNPDALEYLERRRRQLGNDCGRPRSIDYFDELTDEPQDWGCWDCHCEECYMDDGYVSVEDEESSESNSDLYEMGYDSDSALLYALQDSINSRSEESSAATTFETVPPVAEPRTGRVEANRRAAPVDTFYRQMRPPITTPLLAGARRTPDSYDLALLRVPRAWHTLESLAANMARDSLSSLFARHVDKGAKLFLRRKQLGEASAKLLHTELSKRRREPSATDSLAEKLSPPPSPTLTVCNAEDQIVHRQPPLRPISNLQPPPRSSLLGRPRLKLEAVVNTTENPLPGQPAHSSGVAQQWIDKSRTMSLTKGFELQSQKPSLSEFTGVSIKSSTSKQSGIERKVSSPTHKISKKPTGKRRKIGSDNKVDGFDWERWRKR